VFLSRFTRFWLDPCFTQLRAALRLRKSWYPPWTLHFVKIFTLFLLMMCWKLIHRGPPKSHLYVASLYFWKIRMARRLIIGWSVLWPEVLLRLIVYWRNECEFILWFVILDGCCLVH
jgi:hypothetical protein